MGRGKVLLAQGNEFIKKCSWWEQARWE